MYVFMEALRSAVAAIRAHRLRSFLTSLGVTRQGGAKQYPIKDTMPSKTRNAILDANDGLHSARALDKAHEMLRFHDLRQPVLFHMVMTGADSIATYQSTIKALVRRLRNYGCRTEYFGAYEFQPMKGLHAHVFLLIETSKRPPFKILGINGGDYLSTLAERNKIQPIHIAKPKNPMHGGEFFARPVSDKLQNCMEWVAYAFKARSKDSVPSRETYFNSEFTSNTAKRTAVKVAAGLIAG